MLFISEHKSIENYRTLRHSDQVFHKALTSHIAHGDCFFHVSNPGGTDYDLSYVNNAEAADAAGDVFYAEFMIKEEYYPQYLLYDEEDIEKISFEVFNDYDGVFFNNIDEYSVVITRLLIKHTDKNIYWTDERIKQFVDSDSRIIYTEAVPPGRIMNVDGIYHDRKVFHVADIDDIFGSIGLFHDMFFLQWLTTRPMSAIEYVELTIPRVEGMGMMLRAYTAFRKMLDEQKCKLVIKRGGASRFSDELINKYFNIEFSPDDATEENTIYICNYGAFLNTRPVIARYTENINITTDILKKEFREEVEEYKEAVFRDRRILGVLLRGTDYNTVVPEPARPCPIDKTVKEIKAWMKAYEYDAIFVATEDAEYLRIMRSEFPGKILAVSQQRYEVKEFTGNTTISTLESKDTSAEIAENRIEDNTSNYFYACYLVSQCDSFISNSSSASGRFIIEGFNGGKFERVLILN